jgi:hypothetical protein
MVQAGGIMEAQQPLPATADFDELYREYTLDEKSASLSSGGTRATGMSNLGLGMGGRTFEEWLQQKYGSDLSALGGGM